eukprot:128166_1
MQVISGVILLIVYSVLIIQLIYFLISNICYLYHNPQYRLFRAAFCIKQQITTTNISTRESTTATSSHTVTVPTSSSFHFMDSSPSRPPIISAHTGASTNKRRTEFKQQGLETISHCFLMPLCLICLLFVMCIRLKMCYITFRMKWSEYSVFCSYAPNLFSLGIVAEYCLKIILCIPALRIQYMYNSTKWQRMLPIVTIMWMIICIPIEVLKTATIINEVKQYEGVMMCVHTGGFGMRQFYTDINSFVYYTSLILCFSTVIIPIYEQRKMLLNLPKNSENEPLVDLLTKINALSKRVCVSAAVIIAMFVFVNVMHRIFLVRLRQPWLSALQWSLYVEGYLMIGFIYKDWRIRLCPLCSYNHIQMNVCHTTQPTDVHQVEMGIELAPVSGMSSSVGVPNLIRDVSKDEIRENTRTFSQDASLPRFEI